MNDDVRRLVQLELYPDERLVWFAQPEASHFSSRVLVTWTCLLGALYLESASLLNAAVDNFNIIIASRVSGLALFALVGIALLFFAPQKAEGTIYCLTNKRILKFDLTRMVHRRVAEDLKLATKAVISQRESSKDSFWFDVTSQAMVVMIWIALFLSSMIDHLDAFTGGALLILLFLATYFLYDGLHILSPKYRNVSGTLYSMKSKIVYVESCLLSEVTEIHKRSKSNGSGDLFVFSERRGCLRVRGIPEIGTLHSHLQASKQTLG
jgi:hypothetical protein